MFNSKTTIMGKAEIGENAGKIWHALNEVRESTIESLAEKLQLKETDIAFSLGWLARENKIVFSEKNGKTYISNCECLNFAFG